MQNKRLLLSSFFLAAALIAPMAIGANAAAQAISVRVYDRDHKDYHNWDDREEHSYVQFRQEHPKHHYNVTFSRTNRSEQRAYWSWRHTHPDHD